MSGRSRVAWVGLLGALVCTGAWAKADGSLIAGRSTGTGCATCHGSESSAVTVTLSGPAQVAASSTTEYTVTVSGGPLAAAGIDVGTSGGTLAPGGTDTKKNGADIVHSTPKVPAGNQVRFTFDLTAPSSAGTVTLTAAGNSVNLDNMPTDLDDWAFAEPLSVTVTGGQQQPDAGTGDGDGDGDDEGAGDDEGGGCSATGGSLTVLALLASALAFRRRKS